MTLRSNSAKTLDDRPLHVSGFGADTAIEYAAILTITLAVVVLCQLYARTFTAEFGSDESSHYISGLLIYSYLTTDILHSPIAFLKYFHSHYPLVGIGHWGPAYYLVEAGWMLIFSHSRGAMLLLSAVVTAATATCCYAVVVRRLGRPAAVVAALVLVLSPIAQEASGELMLDMPVALLCLAATMAYERFLASGRARYSVLFGLIATAALLIKGNALCLALLPPFAILFGRRFDLPRKPSFWIPVAIVGLVAGPWYIATYPLIAQGFRYSWGIDYMVTATVANGRFLLGAVGPLVLASALIGFVAAIAKRPGSHEKDSWTVAMAALFAAAWTFQSVVPAAIQDRYLAPDLPPLVILAAWGARIVTLWCVASLPVLRVSPRRADAVVVAGLALLAASFLPSALNVPVKPHLGFVNAARLIWDDRDPANPSVLIAADGAGESAAIAELAMSDPRLPSLFAIRGSRLLGGGGYNNQDYQPRFQTADQVMAAIDDYAIPYVLLRAGGGPNEWAHLRQIEEARRLYPDRWQLVYRDANASPAVMLFRLSENQEKKGDLARLLALSAPRSLR